MANAGKIGRNDLCPCGSGRKHKKCCENMVSWSEILAKGKNEYVRHLSARGKNLYFLQEIAAILQFDTLQPTIENLKKAVTTEAVRKIYETIVNLWPDGDDLERVLAFEKSESSGLYVGTCDLNVISKAVVRHSLHSDSILLIDPFLHPLKLRAQYNPLFHPEKFRTTTFKYLRVWFAMAPWIYAGIIKFIHLQDDFDARLGRESMKIQEARRDKYPELREIGEKETKKRVEADQDYKEYAFLMQSDDVLKRNFVKNNPNATSLEIEAFLGLIEKRRKFHPFFLTPTETNGRPVGELLIEHSGAGYDMGKRTALLTGSYLITDLEYRWKEIEIDREEANIDKLKWSPFAKAFQELDLKYLENVPLNAALKLRQESRLQEMRVFLRKIWRSAGGNDSFDDSNALNLAGELLEKVREAEDEWEKIDRDLIKWFGGLNTIVAGAVASGQVGWFPAGVSTLIGGAAALVNSRHSRISHAKKLPAAFFLKLKNKY